MFFIMQSPPQSTPHLQGLLPLQVYLCLHHGLLLCICTVKFLQVFSPGVSDLFAVLLQDLIHMA